MRKVFRMIMWRRAHSSQALLTIGCFLTCLIFLLLQPLAPAWGGTYSPGRMLLVNGQIHRIWIKGDYDYMYHQAGLPADPVNGTGDFIAVDADGNSMPKDQGPYICRYNTLSSVEGLAVFNNKIFVVYTKDTTCYNTGDMSAYVSAFDLLGTAEKPDGHWSIIDHKLGKAGYKMASGAAITVFNGQLYVFTDTGTYTSGDGVHWSAHAPLDSAKQPLDAVTIYPEGDPKILLVFGTGTEGSNYFNKLYAATWNGDFASPLEYPSCSGGTTGCLSNPIVGDAAIAGRVALLPGTRKADPTISGSKSGYTVPAVQLFLQLMDDKMRVREYHVNENRWYRIYDSGYESDYSGFTGLMVYPWYVSACDANHKVYQARHQRFVALGGSVRPAFDSDFMVPQNNPSPDTCDLANGASNPTDVENETTRKYWSLVGVVLGSPPFSLNGAVIPSEVKDVSNVEYGTESDFETKHSQQWTHQSMISTGVEVHAGLFDDLLKITDSFDATFKHDWESNHEASMDDHVVKTSKMGTDAYAEGVIYPVPYSPACEVDADCEEYADPYAGDEPGCMISRPQDDTHTHSYWDACRDTDDDPDNPCVCTVSPTGKTGWALFNAPTLYVQDYAVYAYDYNKSNGTGTDLNQDLHTVEAKGFGVVSVTFDLQHPELARQIKNPDGSVKPDSGLLKGMQAFPYSTDLWGWSQQNWNRLDQPWKTILGPEDIGTVSHDTGSNDGVEYTHGTETVDGSSQTSSIELSNTTTLEEGTKLFGFREELTVGKESSFFTSIETKTSFQQNVKADIGMPNCSPGESWCVTRMSVAPYLLQATGKAPWVPDLYPVSGGKGPWCMTWTVTSVCPDGPNCTTTLVRVSPEGLPPRVASGRIVGGNGGEDQGGDGTSHYSIQGGRLAWVDTHGTEERIPMTADEFVPFQGVTIEVNGRQWSSSSDGSWTRSGNIWTFQTDPEVLQNRVLLRLDFGSATYDFQIENADLEGYVFAGMTDVELRLIVNDKYAFTTTIHHDLDITWRWGEPPADNLTMQVTSFQGRYNSATRSGEMSIAGTLPEDLPSFGDVAMVINGEETSIPLMSRDDFQQALQYGEVFTYVKEGLILEVDFGDKAWSASFNDQAFRRLLAPRWGKIRANILVGGLPWVNREDAVLDYTADLRFQRHVQQQDRWDEAVYDLLLSHSLGGAKN